MFRSSFSMFRSTESTESTPWFPAAHHLDGATVDSCATGGLPHLPDEAVEAQGLATLGQRQP